MSSKHRTPNLTNLLFRQLFDRTSCTYTYLLADKTTRAAVLIDPVDALIDRDLKLVADHRVNLTHALNTHAHADHISATGLIKQRLPHVRSVIGHNANAKADVLVKTGDKLTLGKAFQLHVIETPGHTQGCVTYHLRCLSERDASLPTMIFSGDTLLVRGCGRTDFQGGDSEKLFRSVRERLFTLPSATLVYPGHDYRGMIVSTIGEEKELNPRLGKDKTLKEFTYIMANLKLAYPKMIDTAVPANINCGIPPMEY